MEETDRIREKLADMREYLNEIKERLPDSFERYISVDLTLKRMMERNLQLINDSEIDVLALLVKTKELSIAASEDALIDKFNKILSKKTITHLKEFRRLRNMLTYAYKNEDYNESVFHSAEKLGNVYDFINEIEKIINGRS